MNFHVIKKSKAWLLKFIYSEKATKFCEIFPLLLTAVHTVKSKGKISRNFVAFSEYINFTKPLLLNFIFLYIFTIPSRNFKKFKLWKVPTFKNWRPRKKKGETFLWSIDSKLTRNRFMVIVSPPVYLHLIFEIWSVTRFFLFRNIKFEKSKNQFDFKIDFCRLHRQ